MGYTFPHLFLCYILIITLFIDLSPISFNKFQRIINNMIDTLYNKNTASVFKTRRFLQSSRKYGKRLKPMFH